MAARDRIALTRLDNKSIANTFYETADLMEVRGDDPFRIRSYRRAALK